MWFNFNNVYVVKIKDMFFRRSISVQCRLQFADRAMPAGISAGRIPWAGETLPDMAARPADTHQETRGQGATGAAGTLRQTAAARRRGRRGQSGVTRVSPGSHGLVRGHRSHSEVTRVGPGHGGQSGATEVGLGSQAGGQSDVVGSGWDYKGTWITRLHFTVCSDRKPRNVDGVLSSALQVYNLNCCMFDC